MEIPELAVEKESENLYYVYLFYVEDKCACARKLSDPPF